jgi:hypothetical protein
MLAVLQKEIEVEGSSDINEQIAVEQLNSGVLLIAVILLLAIQGGLVP